MRVGREALPGAAGRLGLEVAVLAGRRGVLEAVGVKAATGAVEVTGLF